MAFVSIGQSGSERGTGLIPGSERLMWYFLRVSGLMLVILAGVHIFVTHYLNVPSETGFDFVAARWANPLWRTFDMLLLFSGVWHGLVGLRLSVTDFLRDQRLRQIGYALVWVFGAIFTVLGTITIVTFDEELARANAGPLSDQMWISEAIGVFLYIFAAVTYIATIVLIVWVVRSLRRGVVPIYHGDVGQYAWVLHRATGIGITFFLLIHIIDIMLVGLGRDMYDHSVEIYAQPFIVPMEVILVGAVLYHLLNGLRIIAINFWAKGPSREKKWFWWVLALSVILTIPSGILIIWVEFL